MKKIIAYTLITALVMSVSLIFADIEDVDADVDVMIEQKNQKSQINTEELMQIVETKLEKKGYTNEQRERIMAKIKEEIKKGEVPSAQLAVRVCEQAEQNLLCKDVKKCEKDIEQIVANIKKELERAKNEISKEAKNKEEKKYKAIEVLESLVEAGIPVEHALNVVKEAMKGKEGDVASVAKKKIEKDMQYNRVKLPIELKQRIREQLQLYTQTQTQLQNQMLEQKIQLQTHQETQQQLQQQKPQEPQKQWPKK